MDKVKSYKMQASNRKEKGLIMNGPVIIKVEKIPQKQGKHRKPQKISLAKWKNFVKGK